MDSWTLSWLDVPWWSAWPLPPVQKNLQTSKNHAACLKMALLKSALSALVVTLTSVPDWFGSSTDIGISGNFCTFPAIKATLAKSHSLASHQTPLLQRDPGRIRSVVQARKMKRKISMPPCLVFLNQCKPWEWHLLLHWSLRGLLGSATMAISLWGPAIWNTLVHRSIPKLWPETDDLSPWLSTPSPTCNHILHFTWLLGWSGSIIHLPSINPESDVGTSPSPTERSSWRTSQHCWWEQTFFPPSWMLQLREIGISFWLLSEADLILKYKSHWKPP